MKKVNFSNYFIKNNPDIVKKLKDYTVSYLFLDGFGISLDIKIESYIKKFLEINNNLPIIKFKNPLWEEIWESYDEKNSNSFNCSFLGNDFLIKYYKNKRYLAFHIAGDIRGNYSEFFDITFIDDDPECNDFLWRLDNVNLQLVFRNKKTQKEYLTSNQQSCDMPEFKKIEKDDLNLSADDLQVIYEDIY